GVDSRVTDDPAAVLGVKTAAGVEVAGATAAAHLVGGRRLELRQRARGRVVNLGLDRFIARLVGANLHDALPRRPAAGAMYVAAGAVPQSTRCAGASQAGRRVAATRSGAATQEYSCGRVS